MRNWKNYTGLEVTVSAYGTSFTGVMVEMTETSVLLKSPSGFNEIQMDRIISISPSDGQARTPLGPSPLAGLGGR